MTTELALTPAASAAATGAVVRAATRTLVVTGPDLNVLLANIAADMEIAPTMEIDSDEMVNELTGMLGRISTVQNAMERERKERKAPLLETGKWLDDGYNPMIQTLGSLIAQGKAKLTAYNNAKIAAQRAAEAAAAEARRREAEEAARKEAEAIAAAKKLVEDAAALHEQGSEQVAQAMASDAMAAVDTARRDAATAAAAVYAAPVRTAPAVKGASEQWSAEVTDKAALIVHIAKKIEAGDLSLVGLLEVSTSALNALAKLQKQHLSLPGVRPVVTNRIAIRRQAVTA